MEKTLAGGEVWDLGGGFALIPLQIDVDGEKVWFSLTKDGREYNGAIMSVGDVYTFTTDIDGEEDVPVILCYVIGMYRGTESTFVQIRYILFDDRLLGTNTGAFVEEALGLWPMAGIRLNHVGGGIRLQYSDDNVFTANIASDNNYGIARWGLSNGNILYHNNLINNIPADAVIALEITAASLPCDAETFTAADLSGDGQATSLDALMILQSAVRNIKLRGEP